jgi:Zn-dependent M28 family amino/carboxypeptidase
MPKSMRLRLLPAWLIPLCVAAGLFVPSSASAVSSAACNARANDTPKKLIPCIKTNDLWNHMKALQQIADDNPSPADGHPSRNSGEPGYKASADYVANVMKKAGYDVTIQPYKFTYYAYQEPPTFSEVSPTPHTYALSSEWNPGQSTGTATDAELQPAGGIVIPPTPTPSSASGCSPADFSGISGKIALVQRGTCNFGVKVQNAEAAGAVGVVIFNEGNPGRTAVFSGSLSDANGNPIIPTIPVAFVSFDTGNALYSEYQSAVQHGTTPPHLTLSIKALVNPNADDYNVIAESKTGDPNHVLVVDAHLDAIYGAGMLDNGSGSVTILDIAQQMRKVHPRNKLRFIWFGGEELGLLGSKFYVNNLTPTELSKIGYDLDSDVTATPNYIIGILDPAAPDFFGRTVSTQFPAGVYEPSKVSRDQSIQFFNSIGKNHELFSPVGTDAFSFNMAGVPASGLLTGQDCCKTQDEVNLFGGETGNYEGNLGTSDGGCVDNPFRWCDNLNNNDPRVLTFMSKAFANTTVRMAFDRTVMSGSTTAAKKARAAVRRRALAARAARGVRGARHFPSR